LTRGKAMKNKNEFDAVIIGAGACGMTAAVTLAEQGIRVAVFEKQPTIGGTSVNFRGTFAVESAMQRERYIAYSRDEAFKNIMEYSHWLANARLVRAIINESSHTILWLQKLGVIFTNVVTNIPSAPQVYHLINNSGEDVVKALAARAKALGVTICTSTPVKQILLGADRITGVMVEENNKDMQIGAGIVIIASGGYANNADWIKKYTGLDLNINLFPIGNIGKMGDGIRLAHQIGAASEGLGVIEMLRTGKEQPGTMSQIGFAVVQPDLWINEQGERFCDESVTFDDTSMGNASIKQGGRGYSIFDTSIVQQLMEKGIEKAMALDFPPGSRLDNLAKELEQAPTTRPDEVFQADSVAELAHRIKISPSILQNTIDEYNRFCARGHDELFAKELRYLRPIRGPQFYAVKTQTVFLGTLGGIKVNYKTEVMDKSGKVIPGLYAGGFDAGGMYGDSYSIKYSTGLCSGFALNSGRLVGKNALDYLRS
jgi:fumarate reductase flavoprotein subunit